jgi:hypothetical protein
MCTINSLLSTITAYKRSSLDEKNIAYQIVENGYQTIFWADARERNGVVFDNETKVCN